MSSKKYKKFLEFQAKKTPLKIEEDKISWVTKGERTRLSSSSDFLESIYLGKNLEETVFMDRSVAAMLQTRLSELETENQRLIRRVKIMKLTIITLLVILIIWAILSIKIPYWETYL